MQRQESGTLSKLYNEDSILYADTLRNSVARVEEREGQKVRLFRDSQETEIEKQDALRLITPIHSAKAQK